MQCIDNVAFRKRSINANLAKSKSTMNQKKKKIVVACLKHEHTMAVEVEEGVKCPTTYKILEVYLKFKFQFMKKMNQWIKRNMEGKRCHNKML